MEEITQLVKNPTRGIIDASLADPHRLGMPPITFIRQVLAVCLYPELLEESSLPLDVRQRAQTLLASCNGGSVGSYPVNSSGSPLVQKSVAAFLTGRDGGVRSQPEDIILSSGSQKTLQLVFHLMSSGEGRTQTGILSPVPGPHTLPLLLEVTGLKMEPYRLLEEERGGGWRIDQEQLHQDLMTARGRCQPRAIYISNPGNPTGHVQDRKTIEEVIRFAAAERLVILAEEVYQDSVYGLDTKFLSYKRVLFEMDEKYSETVELISFHSISSAWMGECGLRGGYLEMINVDPAVKHYLKQMQASSSCAVLPQLALQLMVDPPKPGDASYENYTQEILHSAMTLSLNAQRARDFLNGLPGMSCQPAMGGVFLFPRLHLPPPIIQEAEMLRVEADELYCRWLLEEEALRLGPGSQNRQEDKTFHIRLCVLAPPAVLNEVLARIRSFHLRLLDKFH